MSLEELKLFTIEDYRKLDFPSVEEALKELGDFEVVLEDFSDVEKLLEEMKMFDIDDLTDFEIDLSDFEIDLNDSDDMTDYRLHDPAGIALPPLPTPAVI